MNSIAYFFAFVNRIFEIRSFFFKHLYNSIYTLRLYSRLRCRIDSKQGLRFSAHLFAAAFDFPGVDFQKALDERRVVVYTN